MCYSVKAREEMAVRIARERGGQQAVVKLREDIARHGGIDLHHANAFAHPSLVVYTNAEPREPRLARWGLVPGWVKDDAMRRQIQGRTLNARGETILVKPAFRDSARQRRCIVHVEGFYEHHHLGRGTYPYYIHPKDRSPFALAGLWDRWQDPASGEMQYTFSIVTCAGNDLMRRIHNNPKLEGSRMPVILGAAEQGSWLGPLHGAAGEAVITSLMKPYPADAMTAHPVRPLLGRTASGNTPVASEPWCYPELQLADPLA